MLIQQPLNIKEISDFFSQKRLKSIEVAIASMRNTQFYGYNANKPANFQFPTAQELLQMLKDKIAIKLKDLKYKQNTKD
jgi:hypothetical protein